MSQNKRRFDGVIFSQHKVLKATPHLMETLGEGFRCKRGEFQTFWKKGRILREVNSQLSQCWVLHCENYLAGYITLLADKLVLQEPLLKGENIKYTTFPAVKIGLLAADERARGAGKRLVEWAIEYVAKDLADRLGVRFITVDAFYDKDKPYDASGFYEKLGFNFVNPDETLPPADSYRTMYFDLKPLIDVFRSLKEQQEF